MPEAGVAGKCPPRPYLDLFLATVSANVLLLALSSLSADRGRFFWFAIANVLIAVLVRNELFLNFLYGALVPLFRSPRVPVGMKNCATSGLLHLGGIHAGCGVCSMFWVAMCAAC